MEQLRQSIAKVEAMRVSQQEKKEQKELSKNMAILTMLNHGLMIYVSILVTFLVFVK